MPPAIVWIAEVIVSDRTAEKIRGRHGLDPAEIVAEILSPPVRQVRWALDDNGARQLLLNIRIGGKIVLVVLYPAGDDVWHLASAYEDRHGYRGSKRA